MVGESLRKGGIRCKGTQSRRRGSLSRLKRSTKLNKNNVRRTNNNKLLLFVLAQKERE